MDVTEKVELIKRSPTKEIIKEYYPETMSKLSENTIEMLDF